MSWWNPFGKKAREAEQPGAPTTPATAPELAKTLAQTPEAKGVMAAFYRKWKDPAFLKQLRVLAAHMQKEGVDIKDQAAVKAWIEKNKEAIEKGKLSEPPSDGAEAHVPFVKSGPAVGRNEPCTCGSGKKYKKCCALKAG